MSATIYADDIEDLLGGGAEALPASAPSRISQRQEEHLARLQRDAAMTTGRAADDILGGVSTTFLSRVFHMDVQTVRKRLVGCPIKSRKTSGNTYDLAEAATYLVKPKLDPMEFLKRMKQGDLPPQLQDAYWSAILKRQKVEENARDLWRSDDVFNIMSEVLSEVRASLQMFPTTMERESNFTVEQQDKLMTMLDALQGDIHRRIVEMTKRSVTESAVKEIDIDV